MATNFPTSIDSFTNPTSGDTLDSPSHAAQHANINDAMVAVQTKLGTGSGTIGTWTTFTPNFRPESGAWTSSTTGTSRYTKINDVVIGETFLSITNAGTGGGAIAFDLPVAALNGNPYSIGTGRESAITGDTFNVWRISTTVATIRFYDNVQAANGNYGFAFFFVYEAA